ncbi:MAG: antitoxin [Burkholderiaceae bacterium]
MDDSLTDISVSLSEFKTDPVAAFRTGDRRAVAVLQHDQAVLLYAMTPSLFAAILDELSDLDFYRTSAVRTQDRVASVSTDP